MRLTEVRSLDDYFTAYGHILGQQANATLRPLHVPGRDAPYHFDLARQPYPGQAEVMTAAVKALTEQKSVILVAECGAGKTLMSQGICHAACHVHAHGKPYRALVFCPPHLVQKWQRELEETVPGVVVVQVDGYRSLTALRRFRGRPLAPTWFVVSNNKAKMGAKWRPVYREERGIAHCCQCRQPVMKTVKQDGKETLEPLPLEDLAKKQLACEICESPLWTYTHEIDRWPAANYVHKQLRGVFRYLVIDESHQTKGDDTAIANAMGKLVASVPHVIAMTGTLIGGYADHLRTLLFRVSPTSMVADGLGFSEHMAFNERYGRIEKRVTTREKKGSGKSNRESRGSQSQRTTKYVRPGVMPTLFGRHLLDKCVFLSLADLSDNLPALVETVQPIPLDIEQAAAYREVEEALTVAIKQMLAKGDKRMLGAMLQTLLGYPDKPYGWGQIGYYERDESGAHVWNTVCEPKDLPAATVRPKEQALVDICLAERAEGRQSWIFTTMTDRRDVCERLQALLLAKGLRALVLRSSVATNVREQWIADHGPQADVIISHPQLVETGLDLFSKDRSFNFATLLFYMTGYNLFTLRQASRRAWRLAQWLECRVKYLYYEHTMQERAMGLMGKKLVASQALEGKFSSEGLAALAGEEGTIELALAKSLVDRLEENASAAWSKVSKVVTPPKEPVIVVNQPNHGAKLGQWPVKRITKTKLRQLSLFEEVA
jgi:hypothetical protein